MNTNKLISTIFIDARVANLADLLPDLEASAQVITVNTEQDGLSQIATALTGRKDIDAVHILSHGSSGQLYLGRDKIDAKTLRDHADALATIRATLADNAELLVYGCHVAKNDVGQEFISLLSEMIGAEVAASLDATGSEDLGGNWQLAARTGAIKTTPLCIEGWHGLLTSIAPITNQPPVAKDNAYTAQKNTVLKGNVITDDTGVGIDSDVDANTIEVKTFTVAGDVTVYKAGQTATISGKGALILNSNGAFTFTPLPTYSGTIPNVTYTLADRIQTSLFNTGVNDQGAALVNGSVDPHWLLLSAPTGGADGSKVIKHPWVINDSDTAAIGNLSAGYGTYVYQQTFIIPPDADLSSINVSFYIAADDSYAVPIYLNGTQVATGNGKTFVLNGTAPFKIGSNTLTMNVGNAGGYELLWIDNITGSYTSTSSTSNATLSISVNNPPVNALTAVTGLEDAASITLKLAGTDVDTGDSITGMHVTALPLSTQGILYLADGKTSVVAGTLLSLSDAAALTFKPALNFNGVVSIPFTVTDNKGGTSVATNAKITVTSVNDAPLGTDKIQPLLINSTGYTVTATDFGFTDPDDSSANTLSNVIITAIPAGTDGFYALNGNRILSVALPLTISITDINSNKLTFVPAVGKSGVSIGALSFKVQDNGGTLNGGVDTATAANSLSFTIAALPVATIAVSPAVVTEDGTPNLVYTVTLDKASTVDTVINLTTTGSATSTTDYSGSVVSVTVLAGQLTGSVTIDPTADSTVEVDETVILTLAAGTGYTVTPDSTKASATGTITNDDRPVASIAVSSAAVAEDGASNLVYTVTLDRPSVTDLTLNLTSSGTAVTADYTGAVSSIIILAGATSGSVSIDPTADSTVEADETVILSLATGAGYTVGKADTATGTPVLRSVRLLQKTAQPIWFIP
ncbi:MAG: DUF4347 domain-containing protein [Methylococcales bacterium]|nr:DUF4347 domain-containing protein [Methylococcales bacterium]